MKKNQQGKSNVNICGGGVLPKPAMIEIKSGMAKAQSRKRCKCFIHSEAKEYFLICKKTISDDRLDVAAESFEADPADGITQRGISFSRSQREHKLLQEIDGVINSIRLAS